MVCPGGETEQLAHAKLFHGWAALHVARADADSLAEERALAEIDEALKRWAFGQREGSERARCVKSSACGRPALATKPIRSSNSPRNARWDPIT